MKKIRFFLCENFHFFGGKISVYLNRHVCVMQLITCCGGACMWVALDLRAFATPPMYLKRQMQRNVGQGRKRALRKHAYTNI